MDQYRFAEMHKDITPDSLNEGWCSFDILCMTLVTTFAIWYLQFHWKRRHLYKMASKVHGPRAWPILGNSLQFLGSPTDNYNQLIKLFNAYPDLGKIWIGPSLVYGVSKPEYVEILLSKALSKMYLYKYTEFLVGYGLFTAPVPIWKRHRKIIMPTFNQKILDGFVDVFSEQSAVMNEQLQKYAGQGEFDMFHLIANCTLDIICETAMGIKVNAQTTNCLIGEWINEMMDITFLRITVIWYRFDFIFNRTKFGKKQPLLKKKYLNFTEKVVKEKKMAFDQNLEIISTKRKAFLDLLIELSLGENKLTEEELKDEVNTFVIGGSDTTATANGFIFIMLAIHQEIQNKVYEEAIEILGPDRIVTAQDLSLFKYTERVVKETLRLFPVAPLIAKDIEDDIPLEDGLVLPKGSSAAISIMQLHRNGEYWPEPLKFDPDRFLPEEVAKRHPYSYIPFSGGPRNCPGSRFAMMSLKTVIVMSVRKFKFSTTYKSVEDVKLTSNLLLRAQDGFMVSVEERN